MNPLPPSLVLQNFFDLIRDGDNIEAVQALISAHPEIMEESRVTSRSVLHEAAGYGRLEVMTYLLPRASDELLIERSKEGFGNTGCTCLFRAVEFKHLAVARLILAQLLTRNLPIDIWTEDELGLMWVADGNIDFLRLFQECHPKSLETPDGFGAIAIHYAADNLKSLKYLLSLNPEWIHCSDEYQELPIHRALKSPQLDAIKYLISLDPEGLNIVTFDRYNNDGWTLLHHAAAAGNRNSLEYDEDLSAPCFFLLQAGHQGIDVLDRHQRTPFQLSKRLDDYERKPSTRSKLLAACSSSMEDKIAMELEENEICEIRYRVYFSSDLTSRLLAIVN